ncbi:MAG: hypothetical protein KA807_15380 [Prolixibacteraceae bacterium]|jgi:hypothetical protein|nr:hypothetical protein [Prolixibacteraceae bacterium]
MEYTASRLSEGNKLFPAKISISEQGVTLRVPGFLSGKERTIPFDQISAVNLDTPFVGFSTVKIYSVGFDVIVASGFSKTDAISIKEEILAGQRNQKSNRDKINTENSKPQIVTVISTPVNVPTSEKDTTAPYNEEINKLINFALTDGDLSEKEKQILFKKAEAAGIDLDEFEMVLDAKLYEINQAKLESSPSISAPKSEKYGDVKKCPACGAIVQSFSGKCSDCGFEFRDIQSDATINKLFEALMEADNIPKEEFKLRTKQGFGDIVQPIYEKELHEKAHREKIISRKVQIISNFPVPNTKEPLLEFLTLGISKTIPIKKRSVFNPLTPAEEEHNGLVQAWKTKIDQVVMKTKISMKEDKSFIREVEDLVSQLSNRK